MLLRQQCCLRKTKRPIGETKKKRKYMDERNCPKGVKITNTIKFSTNTLSWTGNPINGEPSTVNILRHHSSPWELIAKSKSLLLPTMPSDRDWPLLRVQGSGLCGGTCLGLTNVLPGERVKSWSPVSHRACLFPSRAIVWGHSYSALIGVVEVQVGVSDQIRPLGQIKP